jgi:hypothetical protein
VWQLHARLAQAQALHACMLSVLPCYFPRSTNCPAHSASTQSHVHPATPWNHPPTQLPPPPTTLQVESTKDLWRVCLKSPHATVEIPELEFEISADGKKRIDSLYNHIAQAVFNLGNHVQVG